LLGEGHFVVLCSPGFVDDRLIGHGAVEVIVSELFMDARTDQSYVREA
jgi:hypothetical protein